ncbi:ROK family protein [Streptomyces sp. NPDC050523]|uniref:ROK family protein n=1 Tax=Streptomyces sp. NPDC050523 TaxID=3365622 RepID=UPI0037A31B44
MADGSVIASVPKVARRKRGRPAEKLTLHPETGQLIGVEFAHRAVRVAAMNAAHEILGTASESHSPDASLENRIDMARRLASRLTGGAVQAGTLNGIGVAVTDPVDSAQAASPWTAARNNVVTTLVRERFGTQAVLDNNTRLAAMAETLWGAATGEQNVLYLRLSDGVSGSLVVGGATHRGAHGMSGQFGHITVDPDGAPCACGGHGCLETVASVEAVLDAYRRAGGTAADVPQLVAALDAGDQVAHSVLERVGTQIGRVLANACIAIGPSMIVVGGELADIGPALMEPIERELNAKMRRNSWPRPRVRQAQLGDAAAALGAIALLHQSPVLPRHPELDTAISA